MGRPRKSLLPSKSVAGPSMPTEVADAAVEATAKKSTAPVVALAEKVIKAEKAVPKTDAELMREMVGNVLKDTIPMAVMAGAQMNRPAQPINNSREACMECQQPNMACKGRHRKMVVLPRGGRAAHFFTGIRINGAVYLSANHSHAITVPADAGIERMIHDYEQSEERFFTGRTFEHNSGSLGRGGGFVPAVGPSTT